MKLPFTTPCRFDRRTETFIITCGALRRQTLLALAKTPPEAVKRISDEINSQLRSKEFPEALRKLGVYAHPIMTPAQYQASIGSEGTRWGKVIKASNIQLE